MPSLREQRALLKRIETIPDVLALTGLVERIATTRRPLTIAFVNQHAFNLWSTSAEFRRALADVDILLRDGIGINIAMRALGLPAGLNMNGTDFIPLLVQALASRVPELSAHAYGTTNPWLEQAAQILFGAHGLSAQRLDGFLAESTYTRRLVDDPAAYKLVVLGMGMPKQERIAAQLKEVASGATIVVCGGAIFDFCAGKVRRAPLWIRYLRMEWLFRLLLEPRRLFSRYVTGGFRFAASLLQLSAAELRGGSLVKKQAINEIDKISMVRKLISTSIARSNSIDK